MPIDQNKPDEPETLPVNTIPAGIVGAKLECVVRGDDVVTFRGVDYRGWVCIMLASPELGHGYVPGQTYRVTLEPLP